MPKHTFTKQLGTTESHISVFDSSNCNKHCGTTSVGSLIFDSCRLQATKSTDRLNVSHALMRVRVRSAASNAKVYRYRLRHRQQLRDPWMYSVGYPRFLQPDMYSSTHKTNPWSGFFETVRPSSFWGTFGLAAGAEHV